MPGSRPLVSRGELPGTGTEPFRWRLSVDTGGTFTDCLARSPDGSWLRAKVLSSGALRGRVIADPGVPDGDRALRAKGPWPPVEDFFKGFACRLQREPEVLREVLAFEAGAGRLWLDEPFPSPVENGEGLELLSEEEAPILAARMVTGTPNGAPLPPLDLRLATTRGTNALLERRGGRTALFITQGFGDLLEIGTQQRRDLFSLEVVKPAPLAARVVEVPERRAADGSVLRRLDVEGLRPVVDGLLEGGFESAAVALMHSYRCSEHEEELASFLQRRGFAFVSASAALAPRIGFLRRAQTAVVDAYLAPVIQRYLSKVAGALGGADRGGCSRLHVMTSAGGLVGAADFAAKDSLVSGPAGGVVGAARAGRASGSSRTLTFDMGGTSTDVSRYDGEFEYRYDLKVGDAELLAPALAIRTVAAGGGSVCAFDGRRLTVGPHSAGADPGPACYGAGGPLTLTDVNLLLGRLDPDGFEIPVDVNAARAASETLGLLVSAGSKEVASEDLLLGLLEIADEMMADAVRAISVRRGYDPADHDLVAFGGAGGQHACAVAELMGIRRILVPADAALLSAAGLAAAAIERFAQRQVLTPLPNCAEGLEEDFRELEEQAVAAVAAEGVNGDEIELRRRTLFLRLAGQDSALEVPWPGSASSLPGLFASAYRAVYGYPPPPREVEVESLEVLASSAVRGVQPPQDGPDHAACPGEVPRMPRPRSRRVYLAGEWRSVPSYRRERLMAGAAFEGPALVFERHCATVVLPSWQGRIDVAGALVLEREEG